MHKDSDDNWIIHHGDENDWKTLFDRHYAVLCQLSYEFVRDRFTAEGIVDDVFIHVWEKRKSVKIVSSVRNYLVIAVRNKCLDYLKSSEVARMMSLSEIPESLLSECIDDDVFQFGELLEKEEAVREAVSSLPPECRAVFEKSVIEGLKYREIAEELGISVNTVKYHMKKAFSLLRYKNNFKNG